jgi:acyl dehydratase
MAWFDDMKIGTKIEVGSAVFLEDEMIAFAKRYDPRDYFMDRDAAQLGPFGKLVASPWFVTATWMGIMINNRDRSIYQELSHPSPDGDRAKVGPSPGFVDLKWENPVEAGDRITYSIEVAKLIELKSRPQWGICRNLAVGTNQKGEEVLRFFGQVLMERKPK